MKIDYSPRASGRTTRMIEWLKNDPKRILLTFSHAEENRLKREYPELSTRILDWRSYQQRHMHGSQAKEIAIDNADLFYKNNSGRRFLG